MRILVVGGGGREHAICRAFSTMTPLPTLVIAPGNAGTLAFGKNVPVALQDVVGLVRLAISERVDLVVVGPEAPLVLGLADRLAEVGIVCCGPSRAAAQLEGSKAFMRTLANAVGAPSPHFLSTRREAELAWALDAWNGVPVLKADGLAGGKGVFLPKSKEETLTIGRRLLRGDLGDAGKEVLLEERLVGVEASLFYACHGEVAIPLPHAKDHKRIFDNDQGPNTGGMGAISPNPVITPDIETVVRRKMVMPVLEELARRGTPFVGFLFVGIMITAEGPKLLEFNVRLGDPEAQAILPRLPPGVFANLTWRVARGDLSGFSYSPLADHTCAVVLSAASYPDEPKTGDAIFITAGFETKDRWLDHAATVHRDGKLVTSGGRVAAVVARGQSAEDARASAYTGVRHVSFNGMHFRKDIGRSE